MDAQGWRPIETAPKDGSAILIFVPERGGYYADQRFQIAHWSGWGGGVWDASLGKYGDAQAPFWQPLPPSPTKLEP